MAKSKGQRLRLLYLLDYLRQNTDEEHPATMGQLLRLLEEKSIPAERKSVYHDISALNEYGAQIQYRRGKNGGYYISRRDFELSELKLLVDAVLSCRFLTAKQSMDLIKKLAALSSSHEAALLRREIVLAGRLKQENSTIFQTIDLLHEAIAQGQKIRFRYFDWGVDLKKHFRPRSYTASPYALLWDDENYYLIANGQNHGMTHYRVDKMEELQVLNEPIDVTEESRKLHPGTYSKEVFGMYRGERTRVKLRFENSLAGVVVDRFGKDIMLIPHGKNHFHLTVDVSVSPTFLGWIAGFGGRAAIVHPQKCVEEYRKLCENALAALTNEPTLLFLI